MLGGLSRRLHGLICVIRAISGCYAGVQCAAMSFIRDIRLALHLAFFSVAVGLAIGLVTTMNLLRMLRGVMAGLEGGHALHVFVAVSIVSLTAVIACWIPAHRATKVDPMFALRLE
jgi:putative ABC transport system permease protein